jgi:hypothetical protein
MKFDAEADIRREHDWNPVQGLQATSLSAKEIPRLIFETWDQGHYIIFRFEIRTSR